MAKIAFYTLGCKVNQADTASMENLFLRSGHQLVSFDGEADVYIINTCVVTNTGQRKSRQTIHRAIRKNPNALIVVTGCYPQTAAEEVKAIAGVDMIIGNQDRAQIVQLVEERLAHRQTDTLDVVHKLTASTAFEEMAAGDITDKTRAFLKIQEGCNQFCTYCIIPYARGPLRSRSLESIRTETQRLISAGFKEIVLIGIHLGCYGKENPDGPTLYDAVKTVLDVPGVQRLRLGSLESVEVEPRLLTLMQEDARFCRHLHLPLQSGCDKTLQAMHRPYTTAKFKTLLADIKTKVPNIAITTDVIVGFPGETEADFETTCKFAESCGFSKMHIFPFSARKGTPAEKFAGAVTEAVKKERADILGRIDETIHKAFLQAMVGQTAEVLFEQPAGEDYFEGLTGNYQRVFVKSGGRNLGGEILPVKITAFDGEKLLGEIIKD
ncbi:tRNA (N(6)-L-threonylcarbamoyladenosine(37)-C(2))-methylthiotransferase MtaB [Phascolarctobacterium faecium]|nr:tRNA (N(6)-L-threonylcarbamoyladenosine(37)-C(2))-methylthiotransferase MtaB [Phascolarctobacterium faecium]MDM8109687.1 tRNA (N(6)-L-threonylcarbamoyladenosine(37)-C(2))-methylthiotransferase MtaB [Phascolarctobacterium faecium]